MNHHADRPISAFDDDKLGYGPFARLFAKNIVGVDPSNGFVFSLNAPWGAGKSSVLALTVAAIEEIESELQETSKSVIVSFNPWQPPENRSLGSCARPEVTVPGTEIATRGAPEGDAPFLKRKGAARRGQKPRREEMWFAPFGAPRPRIFREGRVQSPAPFGARHGFPRARRNSRPPLKRQEKS